MRQFVLILFLLGAMLPSEMNAQNGSQDPIYVIVDEMPEFPNGPMGLGSFIRSNLSYPRAALDAKIEGIVMASFIVEKDGSVSNVEIIKGLGYGCDEEVKRLLTMMPKWKPGKKDGKFVRVKLNIPVEFKLN